MTAKRKIHIFDTTLRDGEQSPGASLTPDEKLKIAEEMGADAVLNSVKVNAPAEVIAITGGGADVAIDYTGVIPAIQSTTLCRSSSLA